MPVSAAAFSIEGCMFTRVSGFLYPRVGGAINIPSIFYTLLLSCLLDFAKLSSDIVFPFLCSSSILYLWKKLFSKLEYYRIFCQ